MRPVSKRTILALVTIGPLAGCAYVAGGAIGGILGTGGSNSQNPPIPEPVSVLTPAVTQVDRVPMNYTLKAFWRMAQKVTLESGRKLSFYDICDGSEEYLNWNTKVSYDGGLSFPVTRALDWQLEKRTAVRAVVNLKKKAIFILAFQPYGVEQDKVMLTYNANGVTFKKTLAVPSGKVMIYAFDLSGVKASTKNPDKGHVTKAIMGTK